MTTLLYSDPGAVTALPAQIRTVNSRSAGSAVEDGQPRDTSRDALGRTVVAIGLVDKHKHNNAVRSDNTAHQNTVPGADRNHSFLFSYQYGKIG